MLLVSDVLSYPFYFSFLVSFQINGDGFWTIHSSIFSAVSAKPERSVSCTGARKVLLDCIKHFTKRKYWKFLNKYKNCKRYHLYEFSCFTFSDSSENAVYISVAIFKVRGGKRLYFYVWALQLKQRPGKPSPGRLLTLRRSLASRLRVVSWSPKAEVKIWRHSYVWDVKTENKKNSALLNHWLLR